MRTFNLVLFYLNAFFVVFGLFHIVSGHEYSLLNLALNTGATLMLLPVIKEPTHEQ